MQFTCTCFEKICSASFSSLILDGELDAAGRKFWNFLSGVLQFVAEILAARCCILKRFASCADMLYTKEILLHLFSPGNTPGKDVPGALKQGFCMKYYRLFYL